MEVDRPGDQEAVISILSKLLLQKKQSSQPNNSSSSNPGAVIKSMKIEIDFTEDRPGDTDSDTLHWINRLFKGWTGKQTDRQKRAVHSDKSSGLQLALTIPAQYIVVVVSFNVHLLLRPVVPKATVQNFEFVCYNEDHNRARLHHLLRRSSFGIHLQNLWQFERGDSHHSL